jgi:hypothetical protein
MHDLRNVYFIVTSKILHVSGYICFTKGRRTLHVLTTHLLYRGQHPCMCQDISASQKPAGPAHVEKHLLHEIRRALHVSGLLYRHQQGLACVKTHLLQRPPRPCICPHTYMLLRRQQGPVHFETYLFHIGQEKFTVQVYISPTLVITVNENMKQTCKCYYDNRELSCTFNVSSEKLMNRHLSGSPV